MLSSSIVQLPSLFTNCLYRRLGYNARVSSSRDSNAVRTLYAQLLGSSWEELGKSIRAAHAVETTLRGRLRIARGPTRLAHVLAGLLRLPRPNEAAEIRLTIAACGGRERWRRTFDDRRLDTWQYQTDEGELGERIGLLEFRFRLEASGGSLVFRQLQTAVVLRWLRVPLPAAWAPRIDAREDPVGPYQVGVHVRVVLPAVGSLLAYEGVMNLEHHHA